MEEVKTSKELGFGDPKPGYEWDAGNTSPGDQSPGRWTVRRETDNWVVIFHSFVAYPASGFYKKGFDPSHDKVVPIKSLTRLWREGEPIPSFIADNIERKLRRKVMEQNEVKALVAKQDAEKLSTYLQPKFPRDLAKRGLLPNLLTSSELELYNTKG